MYTEYVISIELSDSPAALRYSLGARDLRCLTWRGEGGGGAVGGL